ncbi:glutathione S-transferase 1-like [Musca vetustissima]|uniref:glutathione S-transferase 1-like n=1 Tax=Musca vetustissima TaxID=27455 RepID=UPI002AB726DD|nr:glutathione S-transferase 1-like [Musca vetustissima]
MTKLVLYGVDLSPPVRACLLTLKALNLPYEYRVVNLLAKEHLSEDFLKKNPQHTVPLLEENGHIISDSHAIISYLCDKYAKDDALYPKDLLKRAVVEQRMYFEAGVLFQGGLRNITIPLLFRNQTQIPKHQIDAIVESYGFLESFLKDNKYMAGDHLTIADFSIVTAVTSLVAFVEIDPTKFPKLSGWLKTMESLPYYEEANGVGAKQLVAVIKSKNCTVVP